MKFKPKSQIAFSISSKEMPLEIFLFHGKTEQNTTNKAHNK